MIDHLTTDLDVPVSSTVPVSLTNGYDAALLLVEGVFRYPRNVGRGYTSPAVLGFGLEFDGRPVRVRMRLAWDRHTLPAWEKRVGADVEQESGNRPRLVLVSAHGRVRQAVLLDRRGADDVHADVVFDVPAEELPAGGLLLVELCGATESQWARTRLAQAAGGLAPHATVGLSIRAVEVSYAEESAGSGHPADGRSGELRGTVSTGGLTDEERYAPGSCRLRSGLVVINPASEPVRFRIRSSRETEPEKERPALPEIIRVAETRHIDLRPGKSWWDVTVEAGDEPVFLVIPHQDGPGGPYRLTRFQQGEGIPG